MPRPRTAEHGSETMYGNGCPCDECRVAHNERKRMYRARRRVEMRGQGAAAPTVAVDRRTGEVPMTPGQRKLAEILAANIKPQVAAAPVKNVDEDGVIRVPVGEE